LAVGNGISFARTSAAARWCCGCHELRGIGDLAHRIGGFDPEEWDLPPKPTWMRWRTYNRAVEKFDRYESILDDGTFELLARLAKKKSK